MSSYPHSNVLRSPADSVAERLAGRWKVKRRSGLVLPFGVSKEIFAGKGRTFLGPIPIASFRVCGSDLVYQWLPIRDELREEADGSWGGRGFLFGIPFCRFQMARIL